MQTQRRIEAYGVRVGTMQRGPRNRITDVAGVRVGHCTLEQDPYRTGVTVIMPGEGNPFFDRPVAAQHVLNGYGKPAGLAQIEELGSLETPIALTGTLNVGLVQDALVQYMLDRCQAEGNRPTSINAVVCECNDGVLSDIAQRPVHMEHVLGALDTAGEDFLEGSIGAGRGMICHGLKGGIGSASRIMELDGVRYTLGVLMLTNHGKLADFRVDGRPIGAHIDRFLKARDVAERGSAIAVVATDLPVDARQLRRILRRAPVGMARLGAYIGHGSGEVMLGFTTANRVPFEQGPAVQPLRVLREDLLDIPFRAVAECCEEAILNAMICADTTTGYNGDVVVSLRDVWAQAWS